MIAMTNMSRGFMLLCSLLMVQKACAREFLVGESKGWGIPATPEAYNQWAERNRFQIGDSLLFVYSSNQDSVFRVTKDAYTSCSTTAAIEKFSDGYTSFTFNQSGPYHFISGNEDNCRKNEKLVVIVMAERSSSTRRTDQLAPPPSTVSLAPPPSTISLAPPPSTNSLAPPPSTVSPAPVPTTPGVTSPPPSGIVYITPASSPTGESFPSAANHLFGFATSLFGTLTASSIFLIN